MLQRALRPAHALALALLSACGGGAEQPGSASPSAEPEGAPSAQLVCEGRRHDLGELWQGEVVEHTFSLLSRGPAAAEVTQVRASCSCTVAELYTLDPDGGRGAFSPGERVPPGHRLMVRMRYDTSRSSGPVPRTLSVYSSNTGESTLPLTLLADVRPWLVVEPHELVFGRLSTLDERTRSCRIRSNSGERFGLRLPDGSALPGLDLELVPEGADGQGRAEQWELRAQLGPGASAGLMSTDLELITDVAFPQASESGVEAPGQQRALLRLLALVFEPVSAQPARLDFGRLRAGSATSRVVRIESHDPEFELDEPAVYLRGAPLEGSGVPRLSLRPVEGRNAWDVELLFEALPEGALGSFQAILVVEVGHPALQTVEVPLGGSFPGARRP